MTDPVAVFSAITSALNLLLDELHRRRDKPRDQTEVEGVLTDLWVLIREWALRGSETNAAAAAWAKALPGSAGSASEFLRPVANPQIDAFEDVRGWFSHPVGGHGDRELRVEDILRIHAPQVIELAPVMAERQRQLRRGIAYELERRYRESGREAVDAYREELERSVHGLLDVYSALGDFLKREFPLGRNG